MNMQFKLWVENTNELASLVASMMQNRYDYTARLVAADWLDEHDDPNLAKMIRSADLIGRHEGGEEFNMDHQNAMTDLRKKDIYVSLGSSNIHVDKPNGHEFYDVQGHAIIKQNNKGVPVKVNINTLSEDELKAVIFVLAGQMAIYQNREHINEFATATHEFNILVDAYERDRIWRSPQAIWVTRLNKVLERLLEVSKHGVPFNQTQSFGNRLTDLQTALQRIPRPPQAVVQLLSSLHNFAQQFWDNIKNHK
jgi:uncharacterized protein (TIGR02996 family)